jgi:hypothetical protein
MADSVSQWLVGSVLTAPDVIPPVGHALVVIGDAAQVPSWDVAVAEHGRLGLTIVLQLGVPTRRLDDGAFDAIVVDAAAGGGNALAWGASLLGGPQAAEVVFFSEDSGAPEIAALRALGWPNLVAGRRARAWIIGALPILARVGRARRGLQCAQAEVPPPPDDEEQPSPSLPLGLAESRFREGYVRGILAREGNRTAAAERARVPYRTFCNIMRKLGIDVTGT